LELVAAGYLGRSAPQGIGEELAVDGKVHGLAQANVRQDRVVRVVAQHVDVVEYAPAYLDAVEALDRAELVRWDRGCDLDLAVDERGHARSGLGDHAEDDL